MIVFHNVTKEYGSRVLFQNISFKINPKERLGLVGRNGHGKTTLLRMIVGEESPDTGTISMPKNYHLGWVKQHYHFEQKTALQEAAQGLPEYSRDETWRAEKILAGLGFSEEMMAASPLRLSGGFQVRLNLAQVLLAEVDLLLLDEPNNYLDILSLRWLADFLRNWPGELILITHDRNFMDRIISHTLAIHRQKVRKIEGDTSKLYEQIAQEEEIYEKTRLNDEKKRKEMEQFINRFRAKARLGSLVQSRVKTLAKMEKKEKLAEVKNLEFSFSYKFIPAKLLLKAEGLTFGYDAQRPLFKKLDFDVLPGDRICVVGPNGQGKTTLLKILADKLKADQGHITHHPETEAGYYEQTNVSSLVDHRTVLQEVEQSEENLSPQQARSICGAMLFEDEDALKKISVLSGGEKCRVMLGKIIARKVNLLLLDEPTNHLDMQSTDALLEAIDHFPGGVVMVTHNELFLHSLANKLIVFHRGKVEIFRGSYQDFLEKIGWDEIENELTSPHQGEQSDKKANKKALRKKRSEILSQRNKELKPLEQKSQRLEQEIAMQEKEYGELEKQLIQANHDNRGEDIRRLAQDMDRLNKSMDQGYQKLEDLTQKQEEIQLSYEKSLAALQDTDSSTETESPLP